MPGQRPYASRGVPNRGSASERAHGSRAKLLVLPLFALCALGAVGLWLHFTTGPTAVRASQTTDSNASNAATAVPALAALPVATPTDGSAASTPSVALTHPWQAGPGIQLDSTLATRLDEAITGVDGRIGVVVKDLGSGRGAVLNGSDELQSASLYKLPVLYAVFDSGISFSEELPITDEARSYDAGTMELGAGESLSVAEAVERMVTLSDNTSAVMLGSRVGASEVNASIRALGMNTTHYSLDRMSTSALDMATFLETVARGRAISPGDSADMVHLLLRQRVNDRIPRLLPDGVQVAHKTGNLPGVVNDVGLLYAANSTVVVAALVSDTQDETAAATGIARAALAAYSYFDAQPPVSDRPEIPPAPTRPIPPVWRQPNPPAVPTPSEPLRTARPETTAPTDATLAPTAVGASATHMPTQVPSASFTLTPIAAHVADNARVADTPVARFTDTPVVAKPASTPAPPAATIAPTVAPTVPPAQPPAAPTQPAPAPTSRPPTPRPAAPAPATPTPSHH